MHRKHVIYGVLVGVAVTLIWFLLSSFILDDTSNTIDVRETKNEEQVITEEVLQSVKEDALESERAAAFPEASVADSAQSGEESHVARSVKQIVPFLTQAPFGEWADPVFQNACEEAAIIMAMHWVQGSSITPENGKKEIQALTDFEIRKYGKFIADLSVADTAKLIKDYYHYESVEVKDDIGLKDIQRALESGALVIVPADGRKLGNPHFTPPGPVEHMLVIIGYDADARQFITNDPGTKVGAGYRYDENILLSAIRDYPTGNKEFIGEIRKSMILVHR